MAKAKTTTEEQPMERDGKVQPKKAIETLIVKLCDDVTEGRTRDEHKTLEAIASLYTAIK